MNSGRMLPLRIEPVEGEGLDSWLEAVACRSRAPLTQVAEALGLSGSASQKPLGNPPWTIALTSAERGHLALVTGIDSETLQRMTLARWHGRALFIDPHRRRVDRKRLWGRACGSRFCPACLEESGGRWLLSWRLAFVFACTRHGMLLADTCPSCGEIPRSRGNYTGTTPVPGVCLTKSTDVPLQRCRQELRETVTPMLAADSPLLLAQQRLTELIENESDTTTGFAGVYGSAPVTVAQVLADLRTFASRVLALAHDDDLARWGASELVHRCNSYRQAPLTTYRGRREAHTKGSWVAPTDAAATGIALAAALDGLSGTDPQAVVDRIAWLTDRLEAKGRGIAHCDIEKWSSEVSPDLVAIVLGAVHRSQGRRAVRLHYRTTTGRPQRPARGLQLPRARAQKTPVSLWDTWTLQMMPRTSCGNLRWSTVQQALAVSTLQVGAWINLPQALNLLGNSLPVKTLSRTLETLHTHEAGLEILRAVTLLADVLDHEGSPINYERRRKVFGERADFIDPEHWAEIQGKLGHLHRAPSHVHHANRWIYQRLTGNPVSLMPVSPTRNPDDKPKKYPQFTFDLHPFEADELTRHCQKILSDESIAEPLSWEPNFPAEIRDSVKLPGIPLESLHHSKVHQVILAGALSASAAAKVLNTSAAHVRCIVDRYPLSRREVLEKRNEIWRQLYLTGCSISDIGRIAGGSHPTIARELRRMGVEIRPRAPKQQYQHLTQEVIHRYTHLEESLQDIADATGMCRATVRNVLEREGISRRRCGRRPQQT